MKGLLLRSMESGKDLELIYMSDKQQISQGNIKLLEFREESIKAYCFANGGDSPR